MVLHHFPRPRTGDIPVGCFHPYLFRLVLAHHPVGGSGGRLGHPVFQHYQLRERIAGVDSDGVAVDLGHRAFLRRPECYEIWRPGVYRVHAPSIAVGIYNICSGHLAVALVKFDSLLELEGPSLEIFGDRPRLSQRAFNLFVDVDGHQAFANRGRLLHEKSWVARQ